MEPDNVPVYSGRGISLYCEFDAQPPAKVTWFKNGKPFVRHNGENWTVKPDHLYLENATPSDRGKYTCLAANTAGTAQHTYTVMVENSMPHPAIIDTGILHSRHDIGIGENVTLECQFETIATAIFNWQRYNNTANEWFVIQNESFVPNGTDPHFLSIHNFSTADNGDYACWTTNLYGESFHPITLQILKEPKASHMPPKDVTVVIAVAAAAAVFVIIVIIFLCLKMHSYKKNRITVVHAEQSFIIRRVVLEHDNGGKCLSPRVKIETESVNLNQLGAAEKKRALNEYQLPLDKDWEVSRDKLAMGEKLGEGAFGVVFKATARSLSGKDEASTDVAVKMLKDSHTDSDLRDLVSEMEVMKKVGRHANIISLLGCVTQDGLFTVLFSSNWCLFTRFLFLFETRAAICYRRVCSQW